MARKPKETEQVIDVKEPVKKETFVTRWFKDYAVNNTKDLKMICDLTSRSAEEQFNMYLKNGNTEVYAVVFYGTFMTILDFIKNKQKKYNNFTIKICESINIGFCNNDDEENEKVGNFMPIMEYIGVNRNIIDDNALSEDKTTQNLIMWKDINIKKTTEYYKDIQETAFEKLKSEYKVNLRTSEAIFPLFCIYMDNITNMLKIKFREAEGTDVSEVSMNVFGLFDVYYSFNEEDNQEIIEFQPNITMKLALKSDDISSENVSYH